MPPSLPPDLVLHFRQTICATTGLPLFEPYWRTKGGAEVRLSKEQFKAFCDLKLSSAHFHTAKLDLLFVYNNKQEG